jgi:hypothetical protein
MHVCVLGVVVYRVCCIDRRRCCVPRCHPWRASAARVVCTGAVAAVCLWSCRCCTLCPVVLISSHGLGEESIIGLGPGHYHRGQDSTITDQTDSRRDCQHNLRQAFSDNKKICHIDRCMLHYLLLSLRPSQTRSRLVCKLNSTEYFQHNRTLHTVQY